MAKESDLLALRALIDGDEKNEVECARLLGGYPEVLIRHFSKTLPKMLVKVQENERWTAAGRVDVVICAEIDEGDSRLVKSVHVFECKAPQYPAFRAVTGSRWAPTKELCEAESQLFTYVHELQASGFPLDDGTRVSGENIRHGGIIIGRRSDIPDEGTMDLTRYSEARSLRRRRVYDSNDALRLYDWDTVYDQINEAGVER